LTISGADYYVPWLGVVPNIAAEIKLEYVSKDTSPSSTSKIVLKCDRNGLLIDGKESISDQLCKVKDFPFTIFYIH
jgi:hypothetical protein